MSMDTTAWEERSTEVYSIRGVALQQLHANVDMQVQISNWHFPL